MAKPVGAREQRQAVRGVLHWAGMVWFKALAMCGPWLRAAQGDSCLGINPMVDPENAAAGGSLITPRLIQVLLEGI